LIDIDVSATRPESDAGGRVDAELAELAAAAVDALGSLLRAGTDEATAVAEVARRVFGAADPAAVHRIAAMIHEIIADPEG
jgi:hypothetical protein